MLFNIEKTPLITEIPKIQNVLSYKNDWKLNRSANQNLENVKNAFPKVEKNEIYPYFTKGDWSTHDLLAFFLEKAGRSEVILASWAVSEQASRLILKLHENGLIENLTCYFDYRIKDRKYEPVANLERIGTVFLSKIHAKIVIIKGKYLQICIVTSGNLSKNMRVEAGTIYVIEEICDFYENSLKTIEIVR